MAALATRLGSVFLTTIMVLGVMAPSASAGRMRTELLALLNAERAAAGLAPVSMHADLTDDALAWSQHLFSQGSLDPQPESLLGHKQLGPARRERRCGDQQLMHYTPPL